MSENEAGRYVDRLFDDAERYRLIRQHIVPRTLHKALGENTVGPWTDLAKEQSIEEKIDELCDKAIKALDKS